MGGVFGGWFFKGRLLGKIFAGVVVRVVEFCEGLGVFIKAWVSGIEFIILMILILTGLILIWVVICVCDELVVDWAVVGSVLIRFIFIGEFWGRFGGLEVGVGDVDLGKSFVCCGGKLLVEEFVFEFEGSVTGGGGGWIFFFRIEV